MSDKKQRARKFSKQLLADALEHWCNQEEAEFHFDTGNGTNQLLERYHRDGWTTQQLVAASVAYGRIDMADRLMDHFEL